MEHAISLQRAVKVGDDLHVTKVTNNVQNETFQVMLLNCGWCFCHSSDVDECAINNGGCHQECKIF